MSEGAFRAPAPPTLLPPIYGLAPPDLGRSATQAARALNKPGVVLRAQPASWNAMGGARRVVGELAGPVLALQVQNATHCDPEDPTDWLGELACGKTNPKRRQVFEAYAVAVLRAVFFADEASLAKLRAATNDPAVSEVVQRRVEEFGRWRTRNKS